MSKKLYVILAVLVLASLVLAACGPTATPTAAPEAPKIKVCQVTDTGGIDDKSFNQTAYKGVTDAIAKYGNVEGKYLESQQQSDYEVNINAFLQDKC
ncbi:MAG: BMP family ABC transporter substrate-binding protein, partial [Bellilinea sp.]